MRIIEQLRILRRMQHKTVKDYKICKIVSRRIRLAEEIISREKRIKELINQIVVWD